MKALQRVFEYEGQRVRTVMIDGEPWFVAKDVTDVLGYRDAHNGVRILDEDEKGTHTLSTPGGTQRVSVVNEPGLYRLILGARMRRDGSPESERMNVKVSAFKRWVTHEVLPSIRKHGLYATDEVVDKILLDPDFGIRLLTEIKEERERRVEAERTNAILMHVNKTYTATEIAKELGFRSAIALNKDLAERRIQFKQNNTWVLYSDYAARGYTDIKQEVLDNGRVIYHRRWTQLGREFLLDLYNREAKSA